MNKFITKNYEQFPDRLLLTKDGELIMRNGGDVKEYLKEAFAALTEGDPITEIGVNIVDNFHFNRVQILIHDIVSALSKSEKTQLDRLALRKARMSQEVAK